MIRLTVVDLVAIAAEVLGLPTADVLDLADLQAADEMLAYHATNEDPVEVAGVLLFTLPKIGVFHRDTWAVAVLAAAQFLALNGRQLDLEPAADVVRILKNTQHLVAVIAWVRERISPRTEPEGPEMMPPSERGRGILGRMSVRSRRVLSLARDEARRLRHHYIGTEHLLLGLLDEGEGIAARALRSLEVDADTVRELVEEIIGRGREVPPEDSIPFTPRSRRALEFARDEADRLGQSVIKTEHLLLSLLRTGDSVAAVVLGKLGLSPERVRGQIQQLRTHEREPISVQLDELRRATDAAIDAGDFPRAAALRARQRELLGDEAGAEIARLGREIERLRGLLDAAGIDPDEGTAQTA